MIGTLIFIACGLGFAWYGSGILVRLASDRRLRRRTRSQGVLALTFDDGPGTATTPELLDLLEAREGKATFFLIGEYATRNPEIVERIAADGHTICWHSRTHRNQWKTDPIRGIVDLWNPPPILLQEPTIAHDFRPPYGKITLGTLLVCWLRKWRIITWTHPSGDTDHRIPDADEFVDSIDRAGGGVVLMHDMDRDDPERARFVLRVTTGLLDLAERRHWKLISSPQEWKSLT